MSDYETNITKGDIRELKASLEETQRLEDKINFWRTLAGWLIFISAILLIVVIVNTGDTVVPAGYTPEQCADVAIKIFESMN